MGSLQKSSYKAVMGTTAGRNRWKEWLDGVATKRYGLRSQPAYSGKNLPNYWKGEQFHAVQRLYHGLVDFEVDLQKKMIEILADKIANVSDGLKFVVYPANQKDTVYGNSEYTLDLSGINKDNLVWEFASWDNDGQAGNETLIDKWAAQAGDKEYYFVLQVGKDYPVSKVESYIENLRNPSVSNKPDGFGLWSNWNKKKGNEATVKKYMEKVKRH